MNNNAKTVYVGLSGGVDSAVSAALLKDAGYRIIGAFIKTWAPEGYPCPAEEDKRESMKVAAHLGIPWIEINAEEIYKKNVADYMIAEYAAGRTPNPDVFCNTAVKFGTFFEAAMARGADYIATGHYARIKSFGEAELLRKRNEVEFLVGKDPAKDQTYFLWNVPREKLAKTLFPVGEYPKEKVRKLAKKYNLPNRDRPDSQGVCFLGPIDMKAFIKDMLKPAAGKVLNEDGKIIGTHDGAMLYTIGERHGFHITEPHHGPLFVVEKNMENNTLTVSPNPADLKWSKKIRIADENWIGLRPTPDQTIDAVFRYHGEKYKVNLLEDGRIYFLEKVDTPNIAEGQSAVFYDGEKCLGGGIVEYIE